MTLRVSAIGVKVIGSLSTADLLQVSAIGVKVIGNLPTDALQVSALGVKVIGGIAPVSAPNLFVSALGVKVIGGIAAPAAIEPLPLDAGTLVRTFFEPNWREPVRLVQSWDTAISVSDGGHEDRRGLYGRPRLGVSALHTSLEADTSLELMLTAARRSLHRGPWPVWCDATCLTAPASAASTTLFADISSRLWFAGMRVALWDDGRKTAVFARVSSVVWPDRFNIEAPLGEDFAENALVFPCIDSEVSPGQEFEARSDSIFEASLEAVEVAGQSTLLPSSKLPSYALTQHNNDDIFPFELNWVESPQEGMESGVIDLLNKGTVPKLTPLKTRLRGSLAQVDRDSTWVIRTFFDRQQGRLKRFWVAHTLANPFTVISHGASLRIKAFGDIDIAREFFQGLGMRLADGSLHVTTITSIDEGVSDDWYLNLGFVDPSIIPLIERYSLASLVRFSSDELVSTWTNIGGVCAMNLDVTSVPNDRGLRGLRLVGVSK